LYGHRELALIYLAVTGPKGSGKDTVAQLIKELYPDHIVNCIAFADPIKKVINHIFDLDPDSLDQYDKFKRDNVEYSLPGYVRHSVPGRHVVREIGMLMRHYDQHQFTKYVRDIMTGGEFVKNRIDIVTDLRFDNEYIMLKEIGAKIIKITRPNHTYDGHITERGFDDHLVDKIVMNDGDLNYLRIRVKTVIDSILKE
jgi:ABC-type iron transport system FetAB ATPase subunit